MKELKTYTITGLFGQFIITAETMEFDYFEDEVVFWVGGNDYIRISVGSVKIEAEE